MDSLRLIAIGTGAPLAIAGAIGSILLLFRRQCGVGWILAILAVAATVPFFIAAANKPGEYARFALLPGVALMIAAFCAVGRIALRPSLQAILGLLLIAMAATYSFTYERGFVRDASPVNSRSEMAATLNAFAQSSPREVPLTLGVDADPAPYSLPPVDLFRWQIVLLPRANEFLGSSYSVTITPDNTVDVWDPRLTPISWADKQFQISEVVHSLFKMVGSSHP